MKKGFLIFLLAIVANVGLMGQYCNSAQGGANNYISRVRISNTTPAFDNASGNSTYTDNSGSPVTLEGCETYTVTINSAGNNRFYGWIDWNRNFTFDAGELFINKTATSTSASGNFTVGNTESGNYRMRLVAHDVANGGACETNQDTYWGETEDYTINIDQGLKPALSITTVATNQFSTNDVLLGTNNNVLGQLVISTIGCSDPISLKSVQISIDASDNPTVDISTIKLYSTNQSGAFGTGTMLKSLNSATGLLTFSGLDENLEPGDNYFWVAADVPSSGTLDNFIDVEIIDFTSENSGGAQAYGAISTTNPVGKRQLINNYCAAGVTTQSINQTIERVRFNTLDYSNTVTNQAQIDVSSSQETFVVPGEAHNLTVNWTSSLFDLGNPEATFKVLAWIDWDRNGVFNTTTEQYYIGEVESANPLFDSFVATRTILVPNQTKVGFTKMRIRLVLNNFNNPCGNVGYGHTMDFGVRICGDGTPTASDFSCNIGNNISLVGSNFPYEWETSDNPNGPWVATGVADQDYALPSYDSTLFLRAKMSIADFGCISDEGFSSTVSVVKPKTNSLTATPTSLCPGDSSLLETTYTYKPVTISATPAALITDAESGSNERGIPLVSTIDFTGAGINPGVFDPLIVKEVCLNISHPEMGDIRAILKNNATGKEMILFDRSLSGSDFTGCFSPTASALASSGTAPYNGTYLPEETFDPFLGVDPNANWSISLQDYDNAGTGSEGTLDDWSMTFGPVSIEWTPNQGLRTNLGDSTRAQPSQATFYKPNLVVNNCRIINDSIEIQPFGSTTAEVNVTDSTLNFPFCNGESITFTATPSSFPVGSNYVWEHNGVVVGADQDTYTASNFMDGDTLAIILNLVTPCITVSDTDTVFMQITLPFTPEVDLSTSSSGLICQGEPTDFILDIIEGGSNPTVEWYVQSGATRTNVQTGGLSYTDNGNLLNGDSVFVFLMAEETCATPQLVSDTIEVILTPVENITWTLAAAYPTEVCEGFMIRFEGDSGLGTSFSESEIIWTLNGDTIAVNSIIWEVDTLAAGNYTVTAEYKGGGCSSPASISKSHTFDVFTSEEKFVLAKTVDPWNCALDEVTLVAHTYSGLGTNGYFNWYRGNVLLEGPGFNGDTLVLDQGVNGETISCEIISTRSCSFDLGNGVDKFDLLIIDNEEGLIEISSNAPLVCATDDVTFLGDFVFGAGDNPSYEWYVNAVLADITSVPEWHVSGLATGSLVHAELVSSEQCVYPRKPASNTAFVKYIPTLPVTAELNLPDNTGCATETIAANLSPFSNLGTNPKVTWYKNNIQQPGQNGTSYVFEAPASGFYEIYARVESSVQCPSDPVIVTAKKEVDVYDQPNSDFIFERDGDTYFFVANDQSATEYVWDFNGEASATGAVTSHKFSNSGNKTVCLTVTSAEACVSRFCTQFLVLVGIEEFEKVDFELFPNPTDQILNLSGDFEKFEIINTLGQVVLSEVVQDGTSNHTISVRELTSGVYTIRVLNGDKMGVRSFVRK